MTNSFIALVPDRTSLLSARLIFLLLVELKRNTNAKAGLSNFGYGGNHVNWFCVLWKLYHQKIGIFSIMQEIIGYINDWS